jgi:SET domain-containing protein
MTHEDLFTIRPTEPIGHGLFANVSFPSGATLGEYIGALQPRSSSNKDSDYKASIDIGALVPGGLEQPTAVINAERKGSVFRFLNHSCRPNAAFVQARVGMKRRVLVVEAKRRIRWGEQVTIDYGDAWVQDFGPCYCGSTGCRNPARKAKRVRKR